MSDSRYQYEKVNAIKIILINKEGKVLLIKEPETNEWMPGHWGLPGGKTLVEESLYQAFKRKALDDLGIDIEPEGIFKIKELLMEGKTAMMFHAIAKFDKEVKFKGEIAGYKWVGKKDLENMEISEFTEFFNKSLLLECLSGNRKVIGFDLIETQQSFKMQENSEFKKWLESGRRKS
ncbi:hypothetical protein A2685_02410 [Candidatus Woesebacteria bacterium RIFCSPHIGHO2_01_FULL_37_10]|uniref:Nudix hydrolase domain-containing protein n=1 Tax=Candidatus Woesebacteria bacterium RIFCSPHIGHO2_01_FULL_37_10 TaxID=1802489 RepID=A0A1F7XWA3_9BACT|nr:MAG: hypothetical protein A2685_02410 [Candidatus Woesebacteria bacterium RIFCSPHIGHO2_01_FULL_37_10]